jgi:TPR repeat protein
MTGRNNPARSLTGSAQGILRTLLLSSGLLFLPLTLPAADDNLQSLFNFQTKMAAQGSSEAMIKLGEMCEEGLGTEKSEERAQEWYQKARDKGNPDAQPHLDQLQKKRERAVQERAAREKAAREQAAREQAAREQAAREQAEREQAARQQAEREQAAEREAAAKREAAKKEMTPEERAHAREEAIRRAQEADQQSLKKQLEKEKAESDALKRARAASSKKK